MKTDLICTAAFRELKPLSEKPSPWTHVASRGEFPGTVDIPAGYDVPGFGVAAEDMSVEGVTVFNDQTLESIVQRFDERILIDADHLSHDMTKPTEAMGWGLEVRYAANKSELELETPWTPPGREKIATQVYRYISPEFSGTVRYEGGVFKFYPSALTGAGLTNRPKLKALRPVSANRETKDQHPNMKNALTLLCGLIGAPETATEQEITTKVDAFRTDIATSKNRATQADELEKEIKTLREEAVTADLERFADVIEDKESAKELLQTNRAATVKLFTAAQAKAAAGADGVITPIYQKNRATAPDGAKFTSEGASPEDAKKAAAVRTRAQEIMEKEKIPFNAAFSRAQAELG